MDTDYQVNSPLAVKKWAPKLMKEALKETFAAQFMGEDENSLIQVKTELKDKGDRVTIGLRQQLQGEGVSGDDDLEGNEEALETYTDNLIIDQLGHATRSKGEMSEQRVSFDVREENKDALADWWSDRWDDWFFNQITSNTNVVNVKFTGMQAVTAADADHIVLPSNPAGVVLSENSLSDTTIYRFSLALIDRAREKGKLAVNALRPIKIGSSRMLVAFIHPTQVTSLRQGVASSQWSDIQLAALAARNESDNPLYTGALGIYNNVILHESVRIPRLIAAQGGNGFVHRAVLCGAQAAAVAFGKRNSKASPMTWTEKTFDYGNKLGVAARCIAGLKKMRYNGSDFGAFTMSSYDTPA
jgi:N4-gp56 family major capsid protein